MRRPPTLFTLGYEGLVLDEFIRRLEEAGVQTVVDVRELPLSRKRGFSKKAFGEALAQAGIAYIHMPALGCPRDVRDAYRADGDWNAYLRRFRAYLKGQGEAVRALAVLSRKTVACLVCFESDFTRCHRSLVADAAAQAGGPVTAHLTIRTATPAFPERVAA